MFLMKGKKKRRGFTDRYLMKYGAAEGSTVEMTPTAFMTTECWEVLAPKLMKSYCNINMHIKEIDEWWILEVLDGYSPHMASLIAMQLRYEANILSTEEERYSSHVN